MLYATWTSPWKGPVETLRFHPDQNPLRRGPGLFEDVDGAKWHVNAIMHGRVNARRVDLHPDSYSTAAAAGACGATATGPDAVDQWPPYDVEVVPR